MSDEIKLIDLDVLKIKKGDIIITRMPEGMNQNTFKRAYRYLDHRAKELGIEFIMVPPESEVSVLRKEK